MILADFFCYPDPEGRKETDPNGYGSTTMGKYGKMKKAKEKRRKTKDKGKKKKKLFSHNAIDIK